MTDQHGDKDFVEYIIKNIVNHPEEVVVSRKTDEMGVLLEVKVNPEDMGLLIGRSGATAKAIRILARIIGMRNNARVNLRILEPEGSTHGQQMPPIQEPKKPSEPQMRDLDDVVGDIGKF
ncbi:MAG: KH domain-containing protein [Patescibacteria group bacterium]